MKFYFQKVNRLNSGFTLIETLVAISIFTMSILSLMAVLSQGISNTNYAKKKLVAAYLAQEGIEYIRNMRDTYMLYSNLSSSQEGWDNFNTKITGCTGVNGCYFDDRNVSFTNQAMPISDTLLTVCTSSDCVNGPMLYDSATGKYGYVASPTTTDSGFIRQININQISLDEIKVSSTVYWTQGSGDYNMTFSESLYNWIE